MPRSWARQGQFCGPLLHNMWPLQVTPSAAPDSPQQPANKQKILEVLAEPMQTVEDVPERSEDSNVAETGPIWWQGYFQQAGGVGGGQGAYAAFQPAKVPSQSACTKEAYKQRAQITNKGRTQTWLSE